MFGKTVKWFMLLLWVFGCLAWVNVPKAKQDIVKLDQHATATIFIGYSLERKGWLFYSPDYRPNIFWSNSARFLESKHWTDWTEWQPMNVLLPLTLTVEEDPKDLQYSEETLFHESNQEPLDDYTNMDADQEADDQTSYKVQANNNTFGLVATSTNKRRINLDLTVQEALARLDKRLWKEVMQMELDRLKAMDTWVVTDLPAGVNTIDTKWVLKVKTNANLVPMKFKARLVV
ncbi:hypothetical protein NDA12_000677 [Ustilago hordei]|nr:hypothetical protein NDA12_000677 [Ustilago hordei]KAJ1577745.1 hypothetical protein NDA15_001835 [Ustilago hordei]